MSVVQTGSAPRALPPVEIAADGPYDYDARYFAGRAEYFVPSRLSEEDTAAVKEAAERAHLVLGLRYLSRTDIILDDAGRAWILDVNVAPGMTETSLFPQAATADALESDTTVDDLYVEILNAAPTDNELRPRPAPHARASFFVTTARAFPPRLVLAVICVPTPPR